MSYPPPQRLPPPPPTMMQPPPGMPGMSLPPPFSYGMMPPPGMAGMPPGMPPGMMIPGVRPPPSLHHHPMMQQQAQVPVEKPPVTTVFVGNISERAPDMMVRQMLQRCGHVVSWKRVQGVSGKLQTFGFCEFDNPEATLRCIRLLNGYEIVDKKLSVKVDQKTREQLSEYLKKSQNPNKKAVVMGGRNHHHMPNESSATGDMFNLEQTDENTLKDDRMVLNSFEMLMKQYASQLTQTDQSNGGDGTPGGDGSSPAPISGSDSTLEMTSAELKMASMEAANALLEKKEEEKRKELTATTTTPIDDSSNDLPSSEETVAKKPKLDEKLVTTNNNNNNTSSSSRDRGTRDREKERSTTSSRATTPPHHHSKSSRRSPTSSSPSSPSMSRYDQHRGNGNSNDRSSRGHAHERTRSKSPGSVNHNSNRMKQQQQQQRRVSPPDHQDSGLTEEESEEMRERKRLERRLREKELAYRERLKAWETREDKKRHDYEAERKRERQRRKQVVREAKKLKQFLEDYDDVREDASRFKSGTPAWDRLLKQRQKEIEADNKDKQREREELDELKRKLIEKGNIVDHDLDDEIRRMQLEEREKFEKLDRSSSSESEHEQEEPEEEEESIDNHHQSEINEKQESTTTASTTAQFEPLKTEQVQDNGVEHHVNSNNDNKIDEHDEEDEEETRTTETSEIDSPAYSKSPVFSGVSTNNDQHASSSSSQATGSHFIARSVTIKKSVAKPLSQTIQPVNQLFAEDEEEQASQQLRKNRIDHEERKRAVKKLVDSIPTGRDELFAYPIDWSQLDSVLMEKRFKPWINKKIIEYIGEEEPSLNDFICSKIQQRPEADKLLEEIRVVLEEEAELFVMKMWRLIVFETESKRCGLK